MYDEQTIKRLYGDCQTTTVDKWTLIHTDDPSKEQIQQRVEDFKANFEDFFEDSCPLCQMLRESGGPILFPWMEVEQV